MNCEQVQEMLNDYLEGSLAEATRQEVEHHLRQCLPCYRGLKELRTLLKTAHRLPQSIRPRQDLWPGIAARIQEARIRKASIQERTRQAASPPPPEPRPLQESPRESPWWLAAAAAILLAALSVPISMWWAGRAPQPRPEVDFSQAGSTGTDDTLAKSDLARSRDSVLQTRRDLLAAIELRRELLGAETTGILEQNVLILDRAIGEIWEALEQDPENRRLRLLLAAKYQQEIRILQRVSRV
jgi:hypothetical protein